MLCCLPDSSCRWFRFQDLWIRAHWQWTHYLMKKVSLKHLSQASLSQASLSSISLKYLSPLSVSEIGCCEHCCSMFFQTSLWSSVKYFSQVFCLYNWEIDSRILQGTWVLLCHSHLRYLFFVQTLFFSNFSSHQVIYQAVMKYFFTKQWIICKSSTGFVVTIKYWLCWCVIMLRIQSEATSWGNNVIVNLEDATWVHYWLVVFMMFAWGVQSKYSDRHSIYIQIWFVCSNLTS